MATETNMEPMNREQSIAALRAMDVQELGQALVQAREGKGPLTGLDEAEREAMQAEMRNRAQQSRSGSLPGNMDALSLGTVKDLQQERVANMEQQFANAGIVDQRGFFGKTFGKSTEEWLQTEGVKQDVNGTQLIGDAESKTSQAAAIAAYKLENAFDYLEQESPEALAGVRGTMIAIAESQGLKIPEGKEQNNAFMADLAGTYFARKELQGKDGPLTVGDVEEQLASFVASKVEASRSDVQKIFDQNPLTADGLEALTGQITLMQQQTKYSDLSPQDVFLQQQQQVAAKAKELQVQNSDIIRWIDNFSEQDFGPLGNIVVQSVSEMLKSYFDKNPEALQQLEEMVAGFQQQAQDMLHGVMDSVLDQNTQNQNNIASLSPEDRQQVQAASVALSHSSMPGMGGVGAALSAVAAYNPEAMSKGDDNTPSV